MDWEEYAKELLIFQVKVFSLPIEDVSKEKIEEFKNEFNELKKMGKLDWDAEALVENYYDEIGKIIDKLENLLNNEELKFMGEIISANGEVKINDVWQGDWAMAVEIGREAGREIKSKGGKNFFQ